MNFDKDTYRTPQYVFNWLHNVFGWFHLDGCASEQNALCHRWIGKGSEICDDFLADELFERLLDEVAEQCSMLRIYVNPPYSNPLPFVQRAAELRKAGHFVVMLLPADKTVEWYSVIQAHATEVIDITGYYNDKGKFVSGRISFIHPETGEEVKGNNKGSMVAVFDPNMRGFVTRQVGLDVVKQCGGATAGEKQG